MTLCLPISFFDFYDLCRNSDSHKAGGNIFRHDGTGSDNGTPADADTRQDGSLLPDPDIVFNDDGALRDKRTLVRSHFEQLRIGTAVRIVGNQDILPRQDVFPEFDAVDCCNMRPVTDGTAVTDNDPGVETLVQIMIPGRELDLIADRHPLTDTDIFLSDQQTGPPVDDAPLPKLTEAGRDAKRV